MNGLAALVRLALRRDRVVLAVWVLALGLIPVSLVGAYEQLYPDAASRAALTAGTVGNPSIAVLYGPAYDLSTPGGFTAWRYGLYLALFTALMAVFAVTRHTRAEEDSGRAELLRSAVVGRHAALTAAVVVTGGACLAVGVLTGAGLTAGGAPAGPSFLLGLGVAGTGLVFTAVAAVTAQLTEYSRSANSLAALVVGAAFLLRAVGDSTEDARWLSWLSPLAWPQLAKPYVDDRWWVLLLPVLASVAFGAVAYFLAPRRDLGAGLMAQRPGPAAGAASLSGPLGLAWRLQRGGLIGWTLGTALVSAVFGSIANGVTGLVGGNPEVQEVFERLGGTDSLVDSFLGAIAGVFGIVAAVYGVQAVLRARTEETAHRAEPVLTAGASRWGWLGSHLVFALAGPVVLLAASGVATGLGHGLRAGDAATEVGRSLSTALAQAPAAWTVVGAAVLLVGLLPGASVPGSWGVVAAVVALTLFGPMLGLAQWVVDVSPFAHAPRAPGAGIAAVPLVWLGVVAALLVVGGTAAFRRRDAG